MQNEQQIIASALELFLAQGVKGTSLDAVAHRAGVTRVTVYRHFRDKRRGWCRPFVRHYRRCVPGSRPRLPRGGARRGILSPPSGRALHDLPDGRLFARLEEIGRLYPEVYDEFRVGGAPARSTALRVVAGCCAARGAPRGFGFPGGPRGFLGSGCSPGRKSGDCFVGRATGRNF